MRWVLGQKFSKLVGPKKVSATTLHEIIPIKTYKGQMAPDIGLIGVGAGPEFFKTVQAQKCFTPTWPGNQTTKNI